MCVCRSATFCLSSHRRGDKLFQQTEGGQTLYTHRGDKHFYIPGEGNKHLLFRVVVAIMMWMVRRSRMWVKQTFLQAKRACYPHTLPWFLCIFKGADIFAGSFKIRHKPTDLVILSRWIRPYPNKIVLQLRHWPNEFVPVTGAVIRQRTISLGHCLKVGQSR